MFFVNLSRCAAQINKKVMNLRSFAPQIHSRRFVNNESLRLSFFTNLWIRRNLAGIYYPWGFGTVWDTRRGPEFVGYAYKLWTLRLGELPRRGNSYAGRLGKTGWRPAHGKGSGRLTDEFV